MKKAKLGILGVSNHFLKRVLPAIRYSSFIELTAIASRDIEKARNVANENDFLKYFGSYDELLESDVEIVYIPLPNHLHLEWIRKAAKKKKHIICEKPLALISKDVNEIISLANEFKVNIMEAFMYKFHPQWQKAKELVKIGEIGNLIAIHCFFGYYNVDSENIRNKPEYGGGALRDIGCYPISVSRFISEREPFKVLSLVKRDKNFKTDVLTSGVLDFGSFHSIFTVSTQSANEQKVYLYGSSGVIEIPLPFNAYTDVSMRIKVKTPLGEREVSFNVVDQYRIEFEVFLEALRSGKNPPISLTDSLRNQNVIDALFRSEEVGNWVEISNL